MSKTPKRKRRPSWLTLVMLLAGVFSFWALYGLLVLRFPFDGEFWDARGKFGDMFGAFNALFTAGAFAALVYEIRLEYKGFRRQELHSALSAQLDSLVQLAAMPQAQRDLAWGAIVRAPGGPDGDFPIEQAIAIQIGVLDRLNAGEDVEAVPTYGRPPRPDGLVTS